MHRSLLLSSILFIIISDLAISQSRVRVLDIIEQSLPKCEKVWRLVEQPWLNEENSVPQATFDWTNGKEDVSAYVFVFQETTGAENNLRIGNKDDEPYLRLEASVTKHIFGVLPQTAGTAGIRFDSGRLVYLCF